MKRYFIYGTIAFAIASCVFWRSHKTPFSSRPVDDTPKIHLPKASDSEATVKDKGAQGFLVREKEGRNDQTPTHVEREDDEKREVAYQAWLKEHRLENEGVKPFDAETRGIAGGIHLYHEYFHRYPEGGNRELAKALFGDNPKKLRILNWPEKRLNGAGEFIDLWGTPYRIEIEAGELEIRSAGPNRVFWDADDLVAK